MIGVALQIRGQCGSCGSPLPFNALAEKVTCPSCHTVRTVTAGAWRPLLEEVVRDAPQLVGDAGRTSTLFTAELGQVEMSFARRQPRCPQCRTESPLEGVDTLAARGWAICVGCGRRHALREPPPAFALLLPPGALVAFEDEAQIAGGGNGRPAAAAGGATEWYLCFDASGVPFAWEELYDVVADRQGNVYCAGEPASGGTAVWSLDPGRRTRWRTGMTLSAETRLALTPAGSLLVGDPARSGLTVLDCARGGSAGTVGGAQSPGAPPVLDYAAACALSCAADGTIVVLAHDEIRRYTADGTAMDTWPNAGPRQAQAPSVYDLRERPLQVQTDSTRITAGWDGFTYLWQGDDLVKLSRWGQIVWRTKLPCAAWPRPCADASGGVYVLGEQGLTRVAPDGRPFPFLTPQSAGGPLGDEDRLVVAPDGTFWLLGGAGRMRILAPDGAVRYLSPRSREADAERAAQTPGAW
ncbi:MAG TPA: hypothetical protein VGQ83_30295 [Polyangia bacterium]|jgi:LSD1 subclass zinc finger protein